jgi:hypothetical protein
VGVCEVEAAEIVPWEELGSRAARVILPPAFHWITAHAGQPWLSLEDDKLVIRDFSTARVLRARAALGAGAAAHHTFSGSPAHLRYNNNAERRRWSSNGVGSGASPNVHPWSWSESSAERQNRLI